MTHRPPPRPRRSTVSSGTVAADARRERRRQEQRRYRERQRQCGGAAPAPWDPETIEFLITTGWLPADQAGDRAAIGLAYFEMVRDAARRFFGR